MKTVQVIKANTRHSRLRKATTEKIACKRVAAYCRVSTSSEDQEHSLTAQEAHYRGMISARSDWKLAGIYADEGISGTQADKRPEFQRMIADCVAGRIDFIIAKSISRFARNTLDLLGYVRRLKAMGIGILFEKEGINTLEATGELLLTILASLAQAESESISCNIRQGIHYIEQQGLAMINAPRFLGYDCPEPHVLEINAEQAITVRRIFRLFLEGMSPAQIAKQLTDEKVPGVGNGRRWYDSTITYILKNEKYCGDLLIQKYYIEDFLTHKQVKNDGRYPQYFIENNHEPIIPKEVYFAVQGELRRRAEHNEKKSDHLHVRCGICGAIYRKEDSYWRSRRKGKCNCRKIRADEADSAIAEAYGRLTMAEVEKEQIRLRCEIKRIDELLQQAGRHQVALQEYHSGKQQRVLEKCEKSSKQKSIQERDESGQQQKAQENTAEQIAGEDDSFIRDQVDQLTAQREQLYAERADYALCEMHTHFFLDRSDAGDDGSACSSAEDFYRRTDHEMEPLKMVRFVSVYPDHICVEFKMGIKW